MGISKPISGSISSGGAKKKSAPKWVTPAGSLGSFNAGVHIGIQLGATDPNNLPLTFALASGSVLPSGITLSGSGLVSGAMPQVAVNTTTNFTVGVSDGTFTTNRTFSLTDVAVVVLAVPASIAYTPTNPSLQTSVVAGATTATFVVTTSDGTTYTGDNVLTNDDGGNFSVSPPTGNGTISVAAVAGLLAGAHTATLQVTENGTSVSADLTITVVSGTTGSDPVWVTPSGFLGAFISLATIAIQLQATDPNGLPLSFTVTSGALPGGISLSSVGALSGTLASVGVDTTYNFTITADNGTHSTPQAFSLTETAAGGSVTLTTLIVSNPSASVLPAGAYIQFGHGWGASDLSSGNILVATDDLNSPVPITAMRRSTASGTSVRFSDNIARLANSIAAQLAITSITHSGTTATVTTASAHGLSSGAVVHLEGQAPDDYCGAPTITVTGASTFTYIMPTTPATNATTSGVMNYCRVLTLQSTSGTWSNTLPNGKSVSNVIADITANFDNLALQLTSMTGSAGSPTGSGTWNSDLATALAATGTAGQLRTPVSGQGPLVCDIVALMKFVDNTGGAKHATMSAWYYVTAFLDQATGVIRELRCRVWVDNSLASAAMDYYTYHATLKLGSTTVRSSGLSSNAAIDGKLQSIAAASVSTSTGYWHIPGHGFVGGETIRLTSTGTLPTGFAINTDYAVIWIDANNIALTTTFNEDNQLGNSSPLIPVSSGSGTHTVTCWLHSAYRNRLPYCRDDGLADRWTGKTGTFSTQLTYAIHNNAYLQRTKMTPAVDLAINLTTKVAFKTGPGTTQPGQICAKDTFCYGAAGSLQYAQDTGGAGAFHEYGGPWTDKPLRKLRYTNDRGFAQTLRVDAMMQGSWDSSLINDDTSWRTAVTNRGPNHTAGNYSGMPASKPTAQWFHNNAVIGFTTPTSFTFQGGLGFYSFSHRYILLPRIYLFEGGQDLHDFMAIDATNTLLPRSDGTFPTDLQISLKRYLIGGVQYFSACPDGNEPRTDAWRIQVLTDSVMLADDTTPEKPYIKDILDDSLKALNYLINTFAVANDPNFRLIGGLPFGETARGGPGATTGVPASDNSESTTGFMQSYLGMTLGHCYRMYQSTDFLAVITQLYTLVDNLYRATAGNGWASDCYTLRIKRAPGLNVNPNGALTIAAITEPLIADLAIDATFFRTDGVVWGGYNGGPSPIFPAIGDRQEASDSQDDAPGYFSLPPELVHYGVYYVRQPSGTYAGWKYSTTNDDTGIVGSYSAASTALLSGAITNNQTTIVTSIPLIFPATPIYDAHPVVIVGHEILLVTGGKGTDTLTVTRAGYGSTAASALDGATVYVPYTGFYWGNYQNRIVPFPPNGHALRAVDGAAAIAPDGYLTMMRSQAGYGYLTGVITQTAFTNADKWFSDSAIPAGLGPSTFAANNTLKDSINITLI